MARYSTAIASLRKLPNGTLSLGIPAMFGKKLSNLPKGTQFSVELTDEGILYRLIDGTVDSEPLPSWLQAA